MGNYLVYEVAYLFDGSVRYKIIARGLSAEEAANMLPIYNGDNGPTQGMAHESVLIDWNARNIVIP